MQSLTLKAKLLVELADALPINPRLYPEPFAAHTARAVVSSKLLLAYYEWLLDRNEVSLDEKGHVRLNADTDTDDLEFLTSLLHKYDSDKPVVLCGVRRSIKMSIH
jgi:hypothetical protein